ncbi:MAG: hypothetical protein ACTHK2_04580 [Dokdonella sp.]|uniref:hypothetical protein n=1 Tax=Dokdonella sp. TaxID=2291710 RepID=UPI003F7EB43D
MADTRTDSPRQLLLQALLALNNEALPKREWVAQRIEAYLAGAPAAVDDGQARARDPAREALDELCDEALCNGNSKDWIARIRAPIDAALAAPAPDAGVRPVYTHAMGEAAQRYHESFKFAHPLPVTWRWEELWNAMVAAAGCAYPECDGDAPTDGGCCKAAPLQPAQEVEARALQVTSYIETARESINDALSENKRLRDGLLAGALASLAKAKAALAAPQAAQAGERSEDTELLDWLLRHPNEVLEGGGNEWFIIDRNDEPVYFKTGRDALRAARTTQGENRG